MHNHVLLKFSMLLYYNDFRCLGYIQPFGMIVYTKAVMQLRSKKANKLIAACKSHYPKNVIKIQALKKSSNSMWIVFALLAALAAAVVTTLSKVGIKNVDSSLAFAIQPC